MESLQERKAKLEKEMREIEALEKAQSIRESEANKNELIERLLTDLRDAPLGCALPLASVSHVKSVFRQPACKGELCAFHDTCAQIISLTGKASPVKRQGKANGEGKHKLAEIKMSTQWGENKVVRFTQLEKTMVFTPVNGENWKSFTDRCKASLKSAGFVLSAGQIQGVGHKGKGRKFERLFFG